MAGAISAWAASLLIAHPTPVDHALPLIVVAVTIIAAVSHPAIQIAVFLLAGGEIAIPDERLRLIWFGLVLGCAFAAAVIVAAPKLTFLRAAAIAIAAVVLLRWIPLSEVLLWRELAILAFAAALVGALRSTPFAIAVAVVIALVTPAVPLRTLAIPIAVLFAIGVLTAVGMPRLQWTVVSSALIAAVMLFFAWSGVVARAAPLAFRGLPRPTNRQEVAVALSPGESWTLDVPDGAKALILSGANMPRLKRGTPLGVIQPGGRIVSIGDVGDWGFLRREHYYGSRNPLPRDPAGLLRGYGQTAWIDAAGRVPLPAGAKAIRVMADRRLAPAARLQINAFEMESR